MTVITENTRSGDKCQFIIDGQMNIYAAGDLRKQFIKCIETYRVLEFDLSGVSDLDTSGLQLLIQVKRECNESGKEVRLIAHSPVVVEVFESFGMTDFFRDPPVLL